MTRTDAGGSRRMAPGDAGDSGPMTGDAATLPVPRVSPAERMALGRVAVLTGGRSAEREVSLMSGRGVLAALRAVGVDAHAFDPAERELSALKADGFARAFVALHGRHGEDGTVQGALELLGIPYTGSGVMASAIAIDKVTTKRLWVADGLPTPPWRLLRQAARTDGPRSPEQAAQARGQAVAVPDALGLPLVVKPSREGSSIGITRVEGYSGMVDAVRLAARHDADVLCEAFVDGIELTCPVLGDGDTARALPVVRIDAPGGHYDYAHKYHSDDTGYRIPSGLAPADEAEVQRLTLAAYRSLGCRGWGRADLMFGRTGLDAAPRLYLLEMNTSPGMTGHSLVPMSARADGMGYEALCLEVLRGARLDGVDGGGAVTSRADRDAGGAA